MLARFLAGIACAAGLLVTSSQVLAYQPDLDHEGGGFFGALFGNLRSITNGLKPGEQVIVNGMLSATPGAKVHPQEVPVPKESVDALESIAAGSPVTYGSPAMQTAAQFNSRASTRARQ